MSNVLTEIDNGKLATNLNANSKQIQAPVLVLSNSISPTQITSDQNNYAPTGFSTASRIRLTSDTNRTITGLAGGTDGLTIILENANASSGDITLSSQNVASSAANRFQFPHDIILKAPAGRVELEYDGTRQRWWSNLNHIHVVGDVTGAESTVNKGGVSGYAPLDSSQKVPDANMQQAISVTATPQFARMGIGMVADATIPLSVTLNPGTSTAGPTGTVMQVVGVDGTPAMSVIDSHGGSSALRLRVNGGTLASKAAVLSGANIGTIVASPYDGTYPTNSAASLTFRAAENHSVSAHGSMTDLETTPVTTTTRRAVARAQASGGFSIGATAVSTDPGAGNVLLDGNLRQGVGTGVPASAGATGIAGTIAWDTGFVYVCTATNTWKRSAISTW